MTYGVIERKNDETTRKGIKKLLDDYGYFKDLVARSNIVGGLTYSAIDQLTAFKKVHRKHYDKYCLRYSITESPKHIQYIQNKVDTHERLLANGL